MQYTVDTCLSDFHAWSGGKTVLSELVDHPEAYDYIENIIDEMSTFSNMTETDVNDFLWFDALYMLAEAGLYDSDRGIYSDEDEDEDEDEDKDEDEDEDGARC